jgi:hypothetical protein
VSLDVYLVPVGGARFELYSESGQDDPPEGPSEAEPSAGWWARQMARFRATLAEAEAERRRQDPDPGPPATGLRAWSRRAWRAILRRIAETIAEQRLLWQLRTQADARLVHSTWLDPARALTVMRDSLRKDQAKHRRWCVIDASLTALFGPLFFFIPGPNFVSWYFFFRAIAHYLSLRGATHGLKVTVWQTHASPELAGLLDAMALPRAERRARLDEIAAALELKHLTGFVERVAAPR